MQTIKSIARRRWNEGTQPSRTTWYEPLERPADIDRAVHFALARPGVFVNTASDLDLLVRMLEAASRFDVAPTEGEMRSFAEREQVAPLFIRGFGASA